MVQNLKKFRETAGVDYRLASKVFERRSLHVRKKCILTMGNTCEGLVEGRSFQLIADGNSARLTKQPATQGCCVWVLSQPVSQLFQCHSIFTSLQSYNIYFMKLCVGAPLSHLVVSHQHMFICFIDVVDKH